MELTTNTAQTLRVSEMAENLIGSEIIRIASEIKELQKAGNTIYNLTIGDFNSELFPIPTELKDEITKAYQANQTNYPDANGIVELRQAVSDYLKSRMGVYFDTNEILISAGSRPLIYAVYKAIIDPGDKVVFPIPSWNNNHYCHLSGAEQVIVEARPEDNFMPTAEAIKPLLADATLLALCSPLNPTGTTFSREGLLAIADLVVEENQRRGPGQKPLYLMYDQIYWTLTYGDTQHFDPVSLRPELRDYTIYIDGMSKAFAATGVRVGWAFGSRYVIDKMKSILSHVGAWAPKAEQVATANYLNNTPAVDTFLEDIKLKLATRLERFYAGFLTLKEQGLPVDAIPPQAALYLTVKFDLIGKTTPTGKRIENAMDTAEYLLHEAKLGLVPFSAFGTNNVSPWYRVSVGVAKTDDIDTIIGNLSVALAKLI